MKGNTLLAIVFLAWALLMAGCSTPPHYVFEGHDFGSDSVGYYHAQYKATVERTTKGQTLTKELHETLEEHEKAWEKIVTLCHLLGSELDLVVSNSAPPDSSYYGKYYLVQLNVGTRSLEEDGFSGFRVSLASKALAMASQQIVEAKSTKEQLDHYFASFDYTATFRDIQSKYEWDLEGWQVAKGSTYDKIFKEEADSNAARLNRHSSDVVRYQKQLPDLIARYESILASLSARLRPFLDQTNAETARKADRKSLYRDHIEKVVQADTALAGRWFGDDDDMVIVEPVICEDGFLSVTIHLIIYPFSEASVVNVHVYDEKEQHLGLPVAKGLAVNVEGKWVDCRQFDLSTRGREIVTGQEYAISQSFAADKLPPQGKLKLIITGKNVSVNYATDYRVTSDKQKTDDPVGVAALPRSVTTSTKTIRCRREGNHLWVPVEVGSGNLTQQTELLLDTGASVTCIPADIYEKLGRGSAAHGKIQLETANGLISADTDVLSVRTSAFQRDMEIENYSGSPQSNQSPANPVAIAYIQKHGEEQAKKLHECLKPSSRVVFKIQSLVAKGQVLGFKNYQDCQNSCSLLVKQYERVQALRYIIGNPTLNWNHPKVQESLSKVLQVKAEELSTQINEQNVNFLSFVKASYARIYG